MSEFLKYCFQRSTVFRALKVAAIITPILTVINHFQELAALELDRLFWFQAALTFVVPFGVSTFSSAMAALEEHRRKYNAPQVGEEAS